MLCPICHKLEGEWQCQICRRVICSNDARPTSSGVYCVEHAPAQERKISAAQTLHEESGTLKSVKSMFVAVLFLTIGLGIIIYAGQIFVDQFAAQAGESGFSQIKSAVSSLQSVGNLIFYFMIFITAVLGFAWLALSRQNP